jgi:hypothetical protein
MRNRPPHRPGTVKNKASRDTLPHSRKNPYSFASCEEFPLFAKKTLLLRTSTLQNTEQMTERKTPKTYTMELAAEEAKLLLPGGCRLAEEFVRSGMNVTPVPELAEAWKRQAASLRNLAVRLANLK